MDKTRSAAAQALEKLGQQALPALLPALNSTDLETCQVARNIVLSQIYSCQKIGKERGKSLLVSSIPALELVIPPLAESFKNEGFQAKYTSMRALSRISWVVRFARKDPAKKPKLQKVRELLEHAGMLLVKSTGPEMKRDDRLEFIVGVGEIGAWDAAPTLLSYLKEKDDRIQTMTALSLGYLGNPVAFNPLVKSLSSPDPGLRGRILVSLSWIDPGKAKPILMERLAKDENHYVRSKAVIGLSNAKEPDIVPVLARALGDEHDYVQDEALRALKSRPEAQHKDAAREIIRAFPKLTEEDSLRLAHKVLGYLTRYHEAGTPEQWRAWWKKTHGEDLVGEGR
jgi:HEAT repeat protein